MSNEALAFLHALFRSDMPADQRAILCGFLGDPNDRLKNAWRPRPWRPGRDVPIERDENAYVCVATFCRRADGSYRRRKENFAAAHALMVDDVGTKVPAALIDALAPSALVETSPNNLQAWYFFGEPARNRDDFTRLVQSFIDAQLLGADPGMAGCTRVGRLPGFVNGKAKYGGAYPTRLVTLDADRRYTLDEISLAFGLRVARPRPVSQRQAMELALRQRGTPQQFIDERTRAFASFLHQMCALGMLKSDTPDIDGWTDVVCPWTGNHTDQADTGGAIRAPAEENGWHGAFKCHHGGCAGRGWRELTDWLADEAVLAMERKDAET
jgi:hypothetical protein